MTVHELRASGRELWRTLADIATTSRSVKIDCCRQATHQDEYNSVNYRAVPNSYHGFSEAESISAARHAQRCVRARHHAVYMNNAPLDVIVNQLGEEWEDLPRGKLHA
jgi:hypothetical protein